MLHYPSYSFLESFSPCFRSHHNIWITAVLLRLGLPQPLLKIPPGTSQLCRLCRNGVIDDSGYHIFACAAIKGTLTKCRHNSIRDAVAVTLDRFQKTEADVVSSIISVQTETPFLMPALSTKLPADILLTCDQNFDISTSKEATTSITKIALDVTCIRFPSPLFPREDVQSKLFLETKNSFAPYLYKNLQDADKRKRNHKYDGETVSSLLAVHNTAIIPIAFDPLGGLGPSA